jgi:hypothetical protein
MSRRAPTQRCGRTCRKPLKFWLLAQVLRRIPIDALELEVIAQLVDVARVDDPFRRCRPQGMSDRSCGCLRLRRPVGPGSRRYDLVRKGVELHEDGEGETVGSFGCHAQERTCIVEVVGIWSLQTVQQNFEHGAPSPEGGSKVTATGLCGLERKTPASRRHVAAAAA